MEQNNPSIIILPVAPRTFEPERERHLAVKANSLMEAKFSFNLWQLRIFDVMASMVNKNEGDFRLCRIYLRHLLKFFNSNDSNDFDAVRRAVVGLANKKIVLPYNDPDSGEKRWKLLSVFPTATIPDSTERDQRNNYVELQFHPDVKPYLLELRERFKMYDIRNLCNIRSTYSIKMFWLLKEYENLGRREIALDDLRELLSVEDDSAPQVTAGGRRVKAAAKKKTYKLYGDFKKRVLLKSQEDLARHCDISFTFEEKKLGNRVQSVVFQIRRNQPSKTYEAMPEVEEISPEMVEARQAKMPPRSQFGTVFSAKKTGADSADPYKTKKPGSKKADFRPEDSPFFELFEKHRAVVVEGFGVSPAAFLDILASKTDEQVAQAIRVTRRAKAGGQIERSVAGFFVEALRSGFTDQKEESTKKQAVADAARAAERAQILEQIEALRDEQSGRTNDRIRQLTTESPAVTADAIRSLRESPVTRGLIEEKQRAAERALDLEDFRQDRMLRELVKGKIFEQHPARFADILEIFEPRLVALTARLRQLERVG